MNSPEAFDAVFTSLQDALRKDSSIIVLRALAPTNRPHARLGFKKLQQEFGPKRLIETPSDPASLLSQAVGLAWTGFLPVIEIPVSDLSGTALQSAISFIHRHQSESAGKKDCTIVIRAVEEKGESAAAKALLHLAGMNSRETGFTALLPSNPKTAGALMGLALKQRGVVVFLESDQLRDQPEAITGESAAEISLQKSRLVRSGKDLTIVAWGKTVSDCLDAAKLLSQRGIEIEVLDLHSLHPIDFESIAKSVKATNRLAIVCEKSFSFGVDAEIAAYISENHLLELEAPILRVLSGEKTALSGSKFAGGWSASRLAVEFEKRVKF